MASAFLGSSIKVTLHDGRILTGVLRDINAAEGQLLLEDVTLQTPTGRSAHISAQAINRDMVKSLEMLAQKPSLPQVPAAPEAISSSDQTTTRKKQPKKARLPTRGSEADDSALTLEESSAKPSKRTTPHATTPRRKSSNVPVTPPSKPSFNEEFDFAQGLKSFDKKAVFESIRQADLTDPASRLVAHNRKGGVDKYNTKLGIHESVLDEVQQVQVLEPLEPSRPLGDASTNDSETEAETEDDLVNGVESLLTRQMVTLETELQCPCISWKEWKDVLQLANIETGPNLVQRIENAARGVASYVLSKHFKSASRALNIVVLCGTGTKGQCGLRTGAHLINKGVNVTALLNSGETLPSNFEFQLRLYSAAGGRLVRAALDLPTKVDLIIDALADNEPLDSKSKRKSSTLEGEAALYANSNVAPTLSIDLPSGIDPDSGHIMNAWCIWPQETIALAVLKKAHFSEKATGKVSIVDLGLPHAAFERTTPVPWSRNLFGQDWLVETVRWSNS